jgi:hypothetical protein
MGVECPSHIATVCVPGDSLRYEAERTFITAESRTISPETKGDLASPTG